MAFSLSLPGLGGIAINGSKTAISLGGMGVSWGSSGGSSCGGGYAIGGMLSRGCCHRRPPMPPPMNRGCCGGGQRNIIAMLMQMLQRMMGNQGPMAGVNNGFQMGGGNTIINNYYGHC